MKSNSSFLGFFARLAACTALASVAATPALAEDREKERKRSSSVERPVSFPQTERDYDAVFSGRPAVQKIRVPGGLFISKPTNDLAPQSLLAREIEIDIRSDVPTLSDLQMLLEIEGIQITIDYDSLYEAAKVDSQVGNFIAASKFQQIANQQGGGVGGVGGLGGLGGIGGGGIGGIGGGGLGGIGGVGGIGAGGLGGIGGGGIGGGAQGGGIGVIVQGAAGSNNGVANAAGGAQPAVTSEDENSQARYVGEDGKTISPLLLQRALPFRYFRGTVGQLMRKLENTGNIGVWYQDGLILGGTRRYSVSMLQQQDIIQSVVNELKNLGAGSVVGSVGSGQVFYSAPPRTNNEIIEPYLRRISGNMSEVTLQVALVTVQMSRSDERGFDWSALNFGFGQNVTSLGEGGGTTGSPTTLNDGVFTLNTNSFQANLGDVFGINRALSITGAINFLSRMGDTSVAQNVELRTLSGSPVLLRSGDNIPFINNISAVIPGGIGGGVGGGLGGALGGAQPSSVATGLTLQVDPRYDHTSGIVTMDVGLRLVDLVEFVQLDAGNQLGTLSQPRTREQGVNSIIRVPAGQTTIIGGIRRDFQSDTRNGPLGLFGIGNRNKEKEVFWLFAIVRPVVTVYETADSPVPSRSVLDTRTTVNPYDDGSYGAPGRSVGVTTAAPPTPRNLIVTGAATPVEIDPNVQAGNVLRDRGGAGPNYEVPVSTVADQLGRAPSQNQVVEVQIPYAAPQAIEVVDPTPAPAPVAAPVAETPRRSFIRPMNENEKGN